MFSRRWSLSTTGRHAAESSKRHKDKRNHHPKNPGPAQERKKIELLDLDYTLTGRQYVQVALKENSQLDHVTEFLKSKFPNGDQQIPEDAEVHYFCDGRRLGGNDVPKDAPALRYRVLSAGDDGAPRVIWRGANMKLRKPQLETIVREVAAGQSVSSIRETVAHLLRTSNKTDKSPVQSSNQIVVEAAGGLRPGPLQGNNWETRKVQTWLCRYLVIDIRRAGKFLVLRGFNEQYIWHRPYLNSRGYVDVRELKVWLKHSVLASVHSRGLHRRGIGVDIDVDDIRLTCRGKPIRKTSHIRPGETIDFEVPRVVEDKFIEAEAWLLPLSETCIVCGDEKRVSEMPNRRRITAACQHDSSMCKECIGQWITSSMDTVTWDRLKCPECPQLLKFANVRAFATREIFEKYDTLAAKAVLASIPEFTWCLNPKCNSGQIHPAGCSKARCHACKHYLCVRHNVPWHKGETCEEYQNRTRKQRKNNEASEKHVKEITKPCPGCKKNVHKFTGCDHVTCICGHEWCWLCFGRYYRDEHEFLQCHHTQQCRYHDNPPNYEGGRAFMPFINPGGPPRPFMNGALPRERRANAPPQGRARIRPPAPAAPPAPPHLPDDDLFNFLMRPNMGRYPLDPDLHFGQPRQAHLPGPEFLREAFFFNLGHLMQRAGRDR